MEYEHIRVTQMTPAIGGLIEGVDLAKPIDRETYGEIRSALLDRKVIFFRDQHISTEQHVAFGRLFGELEIHPFTPNREDFPEVVLLRNGPENKSYINVWHSDVTWREEPSLGSILRAVEVPEVGGDTLWANMEAAYDGLAAEMKDRLDGLIAIHDYMLVFGSHLPEEKRVELRKKFPLVEHPVIRTHPETGNKSLYVNAAFTTAIKGMAETESHRLLSQLYALARTPEYQVRFRWEKDSIAFWDNRAAQHYPVSDYFPAVRHMERVTVVGDRPV